VTFSAYFLVGEALVAQVEPLRVILWSFGIAAVCMNLFAPLASFDAAVLGRRVAMLGVLDGWHLPVWALLAWVVLVGTLVPFGLILLALTMAPATTVTMVAMLEPIGVVALGWAWFGESLGVVAVLGCVAVVAGIVLAQTARVVRPEPPVLV
jgi:drug/metabolite transporter (DMT)-like permease